MIRPINTLARRLFCQDPRESEESAVGRRRTTSDAVSEARYGTTLVIVELLIIGFEVSLWVALLIWRLSGLEPTSQDIWPWTWLDRSEELFPLLATGTVATAYTLGIVFDRSIGHVSTLLQWIIVAALQRMLRCLVICSKGFRKMHST
jgi:hypothetical protein